MYVRFVSIVCMGILLLTACSCRNSRGNNVVQCDNWPPITQGIDESLGIKTGISQVSLFQDENSPVSITVKPRKNVAPTTEDISNQFVFTIKNISKKAISILRIEPYTNAGLGPEFFSFYGIGGDSFGDGEYSVMETAAAICQTPYHYCLLLPEATFSFYEEYHPVATEEYFSVAFIMTEKDFEPAPHMFKEWDIYSYSGDDNMTLLFHPIDYTRWIIINKSSHEREGDWSSKRESGRNRNLGSCVVLRNPPKQAWLKYVGTTIPCENGYELDAVKNQLCTSLGHSPEKLSYCYSNVLGGYLVQEPGKTLFFSEKSPVQLREEFMPFPPSFLYTREYERESFFRIYISGGNFSHKQQRSPDNVPPQLYTLWDQYPVFGEVDKGGIDDEYAYVPASEIFSFLRTATHKKAYIRFRFAGYGPNYFSASASYELCGITRPPEAEKPPRKKNRR